MIVGHIDQLDEALFHLPEAVQKAFAFIRSRDCGKLEPGKYEIDGERVFILAQRYRTKDKGECRAETHQKYVDIQYIADGVERMGHTPYRPELEVEEDALAERDARFYRNLPRENEIILSRGTYAILFPNDVHRPCCNAEADGCEVMKLVVKVRVDVF